VNHPNSCGILLPVHSILIGCEIQDLLSSILLSQIYKLTDKTTAIIIFEIYLMK